MTREQREAAWARCEAARPAPWIVKNDNENTEYLPFWVVNNEPDESGEWFAEIRFGDYETADFIAHARTDLPAALDALDVMEAWITDLQSGMYVNCVYCGHRYGPEDEVPATMADALKEHVEHCPKHPMSTLKDDRDYWKTRAEVAEAAKAEAEADRDHWRKRAEALEREATGGILAPQVDSKT